MGDRLATIASVPLSVGELGLHLPPCGFGRGLSPYQVASRLETDRNSFSFSFSAPKMTIFDGFGHFRFRPKMYFHFRLFFVFVQKRSNFRP